MEKNQYLLKAASAFAFLILSGLTTVTAQDVKQKDEPRKAKVKILQKEGNELLVLDTTLTIAAGVSTEEAIKNLNLNKASLNTLGAKKITGTSLGSPSAIEAVWVFKERGTDSSHAKILAMAMSDSSNSKNFKRVASDSAKNQVFVRNLKTMDGKIFRLQHPNIHFRSSVKADSLMKVKVFYATDSAFGLSADTIFSQKIKITRVSEIDEPKIYSIRVEGDTSITTISGINKIKFNASRDKGIIILRSMEKGELNAKKKNKKELRMEAESISDLKVQIYPNPTSGSIKLTFQVEKNANTKVRVVNSNGKAVFQDERERFRGQYSQDIELAKYGTGVYVIQVMVGKAIKAEKVLVQ